jgi:hypothetical protein
MSTIKLQKQDGGFFIGITPNTPLNKIFVSPLDKELENIIKSNIKKAEIELNGTKKPEKKDKMSKTTYSIKFDNKVFDSLIMSDNYLNAIRELIKDNKSIIPVVKNVLRNFIKSDINDFSEKSIMKKTIHKISDNLYISTHSSSEVKRQHISNISKATNIPIQIEKITD